MAATHNSIEAIFSDIRAFMRLHPGASVVCSDDPMARIIGWQAFIREGVDEITTLYTIGLSDLKAAVSRLEPGDILRTELLTTEGRDRIAADLMRL